MISTYSDPLSAYQINASLTQVFMPELSRSSKQNRERCANYESISYCGEDGDFADKLKQRLIENGFNTWMDKDDIPAGSNWTIEIDNAIRTAASLILIMTPPAFKSQYVQYEWPFAIGAGVSVVPILLKPTKLHPRIVSLQYLDFTIRRRRPWEDLYYRLSNKN